MRKKKVDPNLTELDGEEEEEEEEEESLYSSSHLRAFK
jgi:hypothetical protein